MVAEIEGIKKRIEVEVPPSGVLYYKYKNPEVKQEEKKDGEGQGQIANKKIIETEDK